MRHGMLEWAQTEASGHDAQGVRYHVVKSSRPRLEDAERFARDVRERWERGEFRDNDPGGNLGGSIKWLAAALEAGCKFIRETAATNKVETTIREAIAVGELLASLRVKIGWERDALRGRKLIETTARNVTSGNAKRKDRAERARRRWIKIAREILARNPTLGASKKRLAEHVRDRLPGGVKRPSISTIRQALREI